MHSSMIPTVYRHIFLFMAVVAVAAPVAEAQPDPPAAPDPGAAEAVRRTLDALFDGMRAGDSAAVRATFHPDARLNTALGPSDTTAVRSTVLEEFAAAVARPHEKVWDERIWNVTVRVDGPLASAWVPYAFYHGDALSHCGINAVQLVRQADGWKIFQLTDTRRQDCDVPAEVRK